MKTANHLKKQGETGRLPMAIGIPEFIKRKIILK